MLVGFATVVHGGYAFYEVAIGGSHMIFLRLVRVTEKDLRN